MRFQTSLFWGHVFEVLSLSEWHKLFSLLFLSLSTLFLISFLSFFSWSLFVSISIFVSLFSLLFLSLSSLFSLGLSLSHSQSLFFSTFFYLSLYPSVWFSLSNSRSHSQSSLLRLFILFSFSIFSFSQYFYVLFLGT